MRFLRSIQCLLAVICLLGAGSNRALAIGWDGDDFLIGGTGSRIGVFDQDLSFKGYLTSSVPGVAGMDLDASGHLVAAVPLSRSVVVFDATGAVVGGFSRNDDLLGTASDLKVAPNGNYIVATQNFGGGDGVREFAPDGTFVRQHQGGWITGVAVVPENRLWVGGPDLSSVVNVFDLANGTQVGSFSIAGMHGIVSMSYSSATNTVLIANYSAGRTFECDLSGTLLRAFDSHDADAHTEMATPGPNNDVLVTTGTDDSILRWRDDGTYVGTYSTMNTFGGTGAIVWAGAIPEPRAVTLLFLAGMCSRLAVARRRFSGTPKRTNS